MTNQRAMTSRKIKAEVRRRIADRSWQPGQLIPKEIDLAEEFNCARATVNKALTELADMGLLERRRKSGTRVALNPVRKATLEIPIVRHEIEQRGFGYDHVLISQETKFPPATISNRFAVKDRKLIRVRALHLSDDKPFMYEDRWINPETAPGSLAIEFGDINANEWLVQNTPFARGEVTFSAANATDEDAEFLQVRPGEAIFIMRRVTWSTTDFITSVRMAYTPGYQMFSQF